VSTETTSLGVAARIPSTTGTTRAISSATATSGTPVMPDWPPTSMIVAPCSASSSANSTLASAVGWSPPSENESGVALTIPMSAGSVRSTARPRTTSGGGSLTFSG
jgi:hypothetical protein